MVSLLVPIHPARKGDEEEFPGLKGSVHEGGFQPLTNGKSYKILPSKGLTEKTLGIQMNIRTGQVNIGRNVVISERIWGGRKGRSGCTRPESAELAIRHAQAAGANVLECRQSECYIQILNLQIIWSELFQQLWCRRRILYTAELTKALKTFRLFRDFFPAPAEGERAGKIPIPGIHPGRE